MSPAHSVRYPPNPLPGRITPSQWFSCTRLPWFCRWWRKHPGDQVVNLVRDLATRLLHAKIDEETTQAALRSYLLRHGVSMSPEDWDHAISRARELYRPFSLLLLVGQSGKAPRVSEQSVLHFIRLSLIPFNIQQIAEGFACADSHRIRQHLTNLVRKGMLVRVGRGLYSGKTQAKEISTCLIQETDNLPPPAEITVSDPQISCSQWLGGDDLTDGLYRSYFPMGSPVPSECPPLPPLRNLNETFMWDTTWQLDHEKELDLIPPIPPSVTFGLLFAKYEKMTKIIQARLLRNRDDVDEAQSDLWTDVWGRLQKLDDPIDDPKSYLCECARHAAQHRRQAKIFAYRHVSITDLTEDNAGNRTGFDVATPITQAPSDQMAAMRRGITLLPRRESEVLTRHSYGMTAREISIELDISLSAAEKALSRGTNTLKSWFDHDAAAPAEI